MHAVGVLHTLREFIECKKRGKATCGAWGGTGCRRRRASSGRSTLAAHAATERTSHAGQAPSLPSSPPPPFACSYVERPGRYRHRGCQHGPPGVCVCVWKGGGGGGGGSAGTRQALAYVGAITVCDVQPGWTRLACPTPWIHLPAHKPSQATLVNCTRRSVIDAMLTTRTPKRIITCRATRMSCTSCSLTSGTAATARPWASTSTPPGSLRTPGDGCQRVWLGQVRFSWHSGFTLRNSEKGLGFADRPNQLLEHSSLQASANQDAGQPSPCFPPSSPLSCSCSSPAPFPHPRSRADRLNEFLAYAVQQPNTFLVTVSQVRGRLRGQLRVLCCACCYC